MQTETKSKKEISLNLIKEMKWDGRKINMAEMTFLEDTIKQLATELERTEIANS